MNKTKTQEKRSILKRRKNLSIECLKEMQFLINSFVVNTFIVIFLLRNMDEVISGFSKWVMALAVPLYLIFYSYWVFGYIFKLQEKQK